VTGQGVQVLAVGIGELDRRRERLDDERRNARVLVAGDRGIGRGGRPQRPDSDNAGRDRDPADVTSLPVVRRQAIAVSRVLARASVRLFTSSRA
jgi:hypothetical protein